MYRPAVAGELGFDTGPFLNVAAFVDEVIEGKDGVLTLVRVVDRLNIEASGPEAPDELPEGGVVATKLVLMLKAGEARGSQRLQVVLEDPDTTRHEGPETAVNFPGGPGSGFNMVLPMRFVISSAGLYWANVYVNKRLMARVPLEIVYSFTR